MTAQDSTPKPKIHTKEEAAAWLRVKVSWLERRAAAREIPFTMLGGAYHFTDDDLAEIVRQFRYVPASKVAETSGPQAPARRRRQHAEPAANSDVALLRPRTPRTRRARSDGTTAA